MSYASMLERWACESSTFQHCLVRTLMVELCLGLLDHTHGSTHLVEDWDTCAARWHVTQLQVFPPTCCTPRC